MSETGEGQLRLLPDTALPAYAHVPGRTPRPGDGHMPDLAIPDSLDPDGWPDIMPFLYGVDLFNAGYYWEAHEAWETLWQASGRKGPKADFLKGLIALAAAGVKARQMDPKGAQRHAGRARDLFCRVKAALGPSETRYFGFSLDDLVALSTDLEERDAEECQRRIGNVRLWPVRGA